MGTVEKAVRRIGRKTLKTLSLRASFELAEFSTDTVVLVLGHGWRTPIPWSCMEGIPQFLDNSCVRVNSDLSHPAPDTLDGYLKAAGVQRRAGNYVAAVLVEAGIVESVPGSPLRIRLPAQ